MKGDITVQRLSGKKGNFRIYKVFISRVPLLFTKKKNSIIIFLELLAYILCSYFRYN